MNEHTYIACDTRCLIRLHVDIWKTSRLPSYTFILTNPNSSTKQFDAAYIILVE